MVKKITCFLAFLFFIVPQTMTLTCHGHEGHSHEGTPKPAADEEKKEGRSGMSRDEFFTAINIPEYIEYSNKAKTLYNENKTRDPAKYKESMTVSKKLIELVNKRHEEIEKGYEKHNISEEEQKVFDNQPLFQYAMAVYADAASTEIAVYAMEERYFMLLKANKLFEYIHAVFPNNTKHYGFYRTSIRYLQQAKEQVAFTPEEVNTYEELVSQYNFENKGARSFDNVLEVIEKVDKAAKDYKPKIKKTKKTATKK